MSANAELSRFVEIHRTSRDKEKCSAGSILNFATITFVAYVHDRDNFSAEEPLMIVLHVGDIDQAKVRGIKLPDQEGPVVEHLRQHRCYFAQGAGCRQAKSKRY